MAGKTAILSVRVLGDAMNFKKALGESSDAAGGFSAKIGALGKTVIGLGAAAAAAVGAAAVGLYKIGETWHEVTATIRAGTGATGEALESLIDDARAVGKAVPAEWSAVGTAVADLNTRLGLSGETLQTVAKQVLEAGRMLGEEVDINQTGAAFKVFRLEAEQIPGAMDSLFRASQATGVSMNELAAGVQKAGPALTNLGFSFEDSIALMGSLDKAGLNSQQVAASLTRSLTSLAKGGEEPADAFKRIVGEMQGYVSQGETAKALDLANTIFGTRGSSQFVQAIQSGVLELDNLMAAAGASQDTILGVAEETMTAAEQWQRLKNNAFLALEPLGSAVFKAAGDIMGKLAEAVADVDFSAVTDAAKKFGDLIRPIIDALGPVIADIVPRVLELAAAFSPVNILLQALAPIVPQIASAIGQLGSAITTTVGPVIQQLAERLLPILTSLAQSVMPPVLQLLQAVVPALGTIMQALTPIIGLIVDTVMPLIETLLPIVSDILGGIVTVVTGAINMVAGVIKTVMAIISGDWHGAWEGIKTYYTGLWQTITGIVTTAINIAKGIIATVLGVIKGIWNAAWTTVTTIISGAWNTIKGAVSAGISSVSSLVSGLPGKIMGYLRNLPQEFMNLGRNMIQGLINGIKNMIGSVGSAIYDIGATAVGGLKSMLGIASPSRVFAELGRNTGQGFVIGLNREQRAVGKAISRLMEIPPPPSIPIATHPTGSVNGTRPAPVQITVNGALDPVAVARQIRELLARHSVLVGGIA